MKEWFENLESRERLTLVAGAAVLLLVLLWVLLINPLYGGASARAAKIDALRDDVARARVLGAEIQSLRAQGGNSQVGLDGGEQSLMIILERTARESGLQVNQSRPMDNGATVRVRLESASFESLVRWMGMLASRYSIEIDIASLERLDTEGMVDAQLTLKRPG